MLLFINYPAVRMMPTQPTLYEHLEAGCIVMHYHNKYFIYKVFEKSARETFCKKFLSHN